MMSLRKILLSIVLLLVVVGVHAQNIQRLTGTVVDPGNRPLEHVDVSNELEEQTAVTDPEGGFEITADEGETLRFTLEGYVSQSQPAKDGMTVVLQPIASSGNHPDSYLQLSAGYLQTLLDGQLSFSGQRANTLTITAQHEAKWGFKTLEWSSLGIDYNHPLSKAQLYAKVGGANLFFTRYGRYFQESDGDSPARYLIPERFSALDKRDRQIIWRGTATAGIRSQAQQPLQYKAEIIAQTYSYHQMMTELQLCLRANIEHHWQGEGIIDWKTGINLYSENRVVLLSDSAARYYAERQLTLNPNYALRMEPFYAYRGERWSLHLGVNLDMNIGRGNLLSFTTDATPLSRQLSFAPSPNIRLKAQLTSRTSVFADLLGSFSTSNITGYVRLNPYIAVMGAPSSHHVSGYMPIDARVGLQLRPHEDLFIRLDAAYRYALHQAACASTEGADGLRRWDMMSILYTDYQRWKAGIDLTYHYRAVFMMHLSADAFLYTGVRNNTAGKLIGGSADCFTPGRIYDHPLWETTARLEGHPSAQWTIYSDNTFKGARWAVTSLGDRRLPAFIEMNIGASYTFHEATERQHSIKLFAELQNLLNRHNSVWYGYENPGIQGLVGFRIN